MVTTGPKPARAESRVTTDCRVRHASISLESQVKERGVDQKKKKTIDKGGDSEMCQCHSTSPQTGNPTGECTVY